MSRVTVGVDAGGTSTVAAFARDGVLVRTASGEASNPSSRGVGPAARTIAQTIEAGLEGARPDAIFVGAAGAGRESVARDIEAALRERFSGASVRVCDDAYIALRAVVPAGDGLVLIAGTGSIAYAERAGRGYRAGGYGYLFGDDGSGFAIGSAAIKLLLRSYEGRAARDAFLETLERELGACSTLDVLQCVYGDPHPVMRVAALAPLVVAAAGSGERAASRIVQTAAHEAAELVKALAKRAELAGTEAPIVFAGGLLQSNSMLSYLLETRLRNDLPTMPIHKGAVEPHLGALAAAERLLTAS